MPYAIDQPSLPPIKVFETDVAAVTAGAPGRGGWVSGSPANLAASASVDCIFDLGQDWHQYPTIQVNVNPVAPSTGLSGVQVSGADTPAFNAYRRLNAASATAFNAIYASLVSSSGPVGIVMKSTGRYITVRMSNSDATNAQGATAKVIIAAYPD